MLFLNIILFLVATATAVKATACGCGIPAVVESCQEVECTTPECCCEKQAQVYPIGWRKVEDRCPAEHGCAEAYACQQCAAACRKA